MAQKRVVIVHDVMIGANVTIIDTDFHSLELEQRKSGTTNSESREIIIEDNVWIGMNVVILKVVTTGKGAVIGANCVITKNVVQGAKVVSAPNRML